MLRPRGTFMHPSLKISLAMSVCLALIACRPAIDDNAPDAASDSSSSTTVTDASITPEKLSKAYLPLGGGTMTGALVLAADPSAAMQAATKQYVDAQISTVSAAAGSVISNTAYTQSTSSSSNWSSTTIGASQSAVSTALEVMVPAGVVWPYTGTTAPTGFMLCDGTAVSRTTYARLFAILGVTHGSGDGATTFHLPDYRGRFLRGVDGGQARDPDAAGRTAMNAGGNTGDNVGSIQTAAYASHNHGVTDPGHSHVYPYGHYGLGAFGAGGDAMLGGGTGYSTNSSTTGISINNSGSNETRPINAGVNYIIKY